MRAHSTHAWLDGNLPQRHGPPTILLLMEQAIYRVGTNEFVPPSPKSQGRVLAPESPSPGKPERASLERDDKRQPSMDGSRKPTMNLPPAGINMHLNPPVATVIVVHEPAAEPTVERHETEVETLQRDNAKMDRLVFRLELANKTLQLEKGELTRKRGDNDNNDTCG